MKLILLTYNIHIGVPDQFNFGSYIPSIKDMNHIAKVIRKAKADIIGLNEVDLYYGKPGKSRSGNLHQVLEICRLLDIHYAYGSTRDDGPWPGEGMTDYVEWGNTQTLNHRKDTVGAYGNAQLSKFPIQYVHNFKLPMTPGNEQRCLLMTEQEIDGKLIHIYNVHLQNVDLPHSAEDRWAQSQVVSRILKADDIPYKILMGDFNWDAEKEISDYADKPLYQIMPLYKEAGMIDTALSLSPAPDKTYPSHHPIERLDYIFTTPNIKILNYQTISSSVSDHLPLRVEIEI